MVDSQKHEVKELKRELKRIDQAGKEECVMCRFVLVFSSVVLMLIILFVFFMRLEPSLTQTPNPNDEPLHSIPITPADFASTSLEYNQRILELGQTISNTPKNPSGASSATPSSGGQINTSIKPAPPSATTVPEGPPPVMLP